jgi:hypothetical protein
MSSPSRPASGSAAEPRSRGCVAGRLWLPTCALIIAAGGSAAQPTATYRFDDLVPGRPPAGLTFAGAGSEQRDAWLVVRDGVNGVLAHARQERLGPALALVERTPSSGLTISSRLRFPEGAGTAGLAWRFHDAHNYYAVALDLRAQDVRIYRFAGGNRTRLEEEDDLELDPGTWHTLKVEHNGVRIRVWINGVPVAGARDRTRPQPGAAGVWTSGDSTVWFDDVRVASLRDTPRPSRQ